MFGYCTRALRFSEQAAYARITAVRAARRFPRLVDELVTGDLTLSSVGLLAPHLTEANAEMLIVATRGKSTRDVERMVAAIHAQPDIPASIRALPAGAITTPPDSATRTAPARLTVEQSEAEVAPTPRAIPPAPTASVTRRPALTPVSDRRYLLRLTVSDTTHEKLQRLRDLMRHSVPDGDPAEIIDRALTLLLDHVERRKTAAVARRRRTTSRFGAARTTRTRRCGSLERRTSSSDRDDIGSRRAIRPGSIESCESSLGRWPVRPPRQSWRTSRPPPWPWRPR